MIKKSKEFFWCVGLLLAAAVYLNISRREVAPVSKIPEITLPGIRPDQGPLTISGHPGKPLVINFFASWCGICASETEVLKELDRLTQDAGGSLFGIASHDTQAAVRQSGKLSERPYPLALDEHGTYASQIRLDGVPQTILVDPQGKIVYHVRGRMDRYHINMIQKHLKSFKRS